MNSLIYDWKWKLTSFAKDTKVYISCLRISGKSRDIISFESDSRKSYKSHQVPASAFPYLPISHLSESKQQCCIFQNPPRIQNLPCEEHIWLWGDNRILFFLNFPPPHNFVSVSCYYACIQILSTEALFLTQKQILLLKFHFNFFSQDWNQAYSFNF